MAYKSVAGTPGTGGSIVPGPANGGPGGNATYYYYSNAAGTDKASVYGGGGGSGWSGGGAGGAGGYAKSKVIPRPAVNSVNQDYSWSRAFGGNGGNAGENPPITGSFDGGAGGNAYAYATSSNTLGTARAAAYARGGNGGAGVGPAASGGAAGTATITGVVNATGLSAIVKVVQAAGSGGSGTAGAAGAAGANSALVNMVSGTATGGAGSRLQLTQGAYAGQGGTSGGGAAGAAGSAKSYLTFNDATTNPSHLAGSLYGTANADGGNGGGYFYGGATAPVGGAANASIELNGANLVRGYADAQAGSGGSSGAGAANGGAGGVATVTQAKAASTSTTSSAGVNAQAVGGAGGEGYGAGRSGGQGGLAVLPVAYAGGFNASVLEIQTGGAGGQGLKGASGGNGTASVLLNQVTAASFGGTIILNQTAKGGGGGSSYSGAPGQGGVGNSSLTFNDHANPVAAKYIRGYAVAYGGVGGSGLQNNAGVVGTTATTYSNITGSRNVDAIARSERAGGGGQSGHAGPVGSGLAGVIDGTAPGATGGAALATAKATSSTSQADKISAGALAYGGYGGNGWGVNGGAGGAASGATAHAYAPDDSAAGTSYGAATQAGGTGGEGYGPGTTGGKGGLASGTVAYAQGFNVSVQAKQTGGGGGAGAGGGSGGAGANSLLNNAISGVSGGGFLYLEQTAQGGGGGSGTANGGAGGDASTDMVFNDNTNVLRSSDLVGKVYAIGGSSGASAVGGATVATAAATGGSAYAGQYLTGSHTVDARFTNASGGAGSMVESGGLTGGTGGGATADAGAKSTTTTNSRVGAYAHATGGAGGEIIDSGTGNGGAGGSVRASYAGAEALTGTGLAEAGLVARGGNGGAVLTTTNATGQTGGAGGGIISGEYAAVKAIGFNAIAYTRQYGGNGGAGASGANGGAGRSLTVSNAVYGKTTGGYLTLNQYATGGSGGASAGGVAGAAGYADSYLVRSDTSASTFTGLSRAAGGAGGNGSGTTTAAAGADAYSEASIKGAAIVSATAQATGGAGGYSTGSGGVAAGGTAKAYALGVSTSAASDKVTATATAAGGSGGSVQASGIGSGGEGGGAIGAVAIADPAQGEDIAAATQTGGAGGSGSGAGHMGGQGGVVAGTYAKAYGGYNAVAQTTQSGGQGGRGLNGAGGGNGAVSILSNTSVIDPAGLGPSTIDETATGGAGGGSSGGAGGIGGGGSANLQTNISALKLSTISGNVKGYGGAGGYGTSGGTAGAGGYGESLILLTGYQHVSANATSTGGAGGSATARGAGGVAKATAQAVGTSVTSLTGTATAGAYAGGGSGGTQGNATANAAAYTAGGQLASATATGNGTLDMVSTIAKTSSAAISNIVTASTSTTTGTGDVQMASSAETGGITPVAGFNTDYAYADGTPITSSIDSTLSNNAAYADVAAVLGSVDSTASLIGYGLEGMTSQTAGPTSQSVTSTETFFATQAQLAGNLDLGLLAGTQIGSGITGLAFSVKVGTDVVVNEGFSSAAAANAYFDDNVIDLGQYESTSPAGATVTVTFTTTADAQNSGYDTSFVLGSTGVNGPPVFAVLASTPSLRQGTATAIAGFGLSEAGNLTGVTFNVAVQDTTGVLSAPGETADYTLSNGGTELTIANATSAEVNAVLSHLEVDEPVGSESGDTLVFSATDSNGGAAVPYDAAITVIGKPVITAPAALIGVGQPSLLPGVSVSEAGAPTSDLFTVTLTDSAGDLNFATSALTTAMAADPALSVNGLNTTSVELGGTEIGVDDALAGLGETDSSTAADTIVINATDTTLGNAATAADLAVTVAGLPVITTPVIGVHFGVGIAGAVAGLNAAETATIPISVAESNASASELFDVTVKDSDGILSEGGVSLASLSFIGNLATVNADLAATEATNLASGTITVSAQDAFGNYATPAVVTFSVYDTPAQLAALTAADITTLAGGGVTSLPVNGGTAILTLPLASELAAAGITVSDPSGVEINDTVADFATSFTATLIAKLPGVGVSAIVATNGPLALTAAQVIAVEAANAAGGALYLQSDAGSVSLADTTAHIAAMTAAELAGLENLSITTITASQGTALSPNLALSILQLQALTTAFSTVQVIAPAGGVLELYDSAAALEALTPAEYQALDQLPISLISTGDATLNFTAAQAEALVDDLPSATVLAAAGGVVTLADTAADIKALLDLGAGTVGVIGQRLPIATLTATDGAIALDASEAIALETANQDYGLGLTVTAPAGDTVALADTAAAIAAMSPTQLAGLTALGISEVNVTDASLVLSVAQALALYDPLPITVPAGDSVIVADTEAEIDSLTQAEISGLAALGVTEIEVSNLTGLAPLTIEPGITLAVSGAVPASQTITFAGASAAAGGVLSLTDTPDFSGTVYGFTSLDGIDLTDAAYDPGAFAFLGVGNVLSVTELSGTFTIQLDPNQVFLTLPTWLAGADSGTGTVLTYSQAPVTYSYDQVAAGTDVDGPVIGVGGIVEASSGATVNRAILEPGGVLVADYGSTVTDTVIDSGATLELEDIGTAGGGIMFGPVVAGVGGTLDIAGGNNLAATISQFAPGDIIDFTGIPYADGGSAAIVDGSLVVNDNGYAFSLPVDPDQDFLNQSFTLSADPNGGIDVNEVQAPLISSATITALHYVDGADVIGPGVLTIAAGGTLNAGGIDSNGLVDLQHGGTIGGSIGFAGSGGTLEIDGMTMPAATITGFSDGDAIDLTGIAFDPDGTVGTLTGNLLQIVENALTYDLQLDPTADYSNATFTLGDLSGATAVTVTGVAVSSALPPTIEEVFGPGTLSEIGTAYTLDLGTVLEGSSPVIAAIGVLNATGTLSGSFSTANPGAFTNANLTFAGIGAGQTYTNATVTLATGTAGTFSEVLTLASTSSNGLSSTPLAPETLSIVGTISPVATTSVIGTPGSAGGAGAAGGAGQTVTATSDDPAVTENLAEAQGGAGGAGGAGTNSANGAGGPAGAGGAGGGATATATATSPIATATATGGAGGAGGAPGQGIIIGHSAAGGAGGAATASATAGNFFGVGTATATATGGAGGAAYGAATNGGAGGVASGTTASASGTTAADASVTQTGGAGGAGSQGAAGNSGAASTLNSAVSGETDDGVLTLDQTAVGGAGGASANSFGGGGGAANSSLTFNDASQNATLSAAIFATVAALGGNSGAGTIYHALGGAANVTASVTGTGDVTVTGEATGGVGSTGSGGNAADKVAAVAGAAAVATAYATGGLGGSDGTNGGLVTADVASASGQSATAIAVATGGAGGTGSGAGGSAGAGGVASGASATATGVGSATASATQIGGTGGNGSNGAAGGVGGQSNIVNAVSGATDGGVLTLIEVGVGGAGGSSDTGAGGAGGTDVSQLTFSAIGKPAQTIDATVAGTGGNGGTGASVGAGGNAWVAGTVSGTGNTSLQVSAQGGSGRVGGVAQAKANASGAVVDVTASADGGTGGQTAGIASAAAQGNGASGMATAQSATALQPGSLIISASGYASADVGGSTTAASQAAVSVYGPWSTGLGAIASITGAPLPANVTGVLAADPNTAAALTGNATVIALGEVGGAYSASGTASETSTATTDITFDQALLAAQPDLLFSLYHPTTSGSGTSGIVFSVSANGTNLVSENFASAAAATTWFTDHPLDLGTIAGASAIDLHVALSITSTRPGSSFDAGFLVADRAA